MFSFFSRRYVQKESVFLFPNSFVNFFPSPSFSIISSGNAASNSYTGVRPRSKNPLSPSFSSLSKPPPLPSLSAERVERATTFCVSSPPPLRETLERGGRGSLLLPPSTYLSGDLLGGGGGRAKRNWKLTEQQQQQRHTKSGEGRKWERGKRGGEKPPEEEKLPVTPFFLSPPHLHTTAPSPLPPQRAGVSSSPPGYCYFLKEKRKLPLGCGGLQTNCFFWVL